MRGEGTASGGRHERQMSVDSGSAELDWSSEESGSPTRPAFVTVVSVGSSVAAPPTTASDVADVAEGESFVTVLAIGAGGPGEVPAGQQAVASIDSTETQILQDHGGTGQKEVRLREVHPDSVLHDPVQTVHNVPSEKEKTVSEIAQTTMPTKQQASLPTVQQVSPAKQQVSVAVVEQVPMPATQKVSPPTEQQVSVFDKQQAHMSAVGSSEEDDGDDEADDADEPDVEDVVVYRLPGERLGFGLRFEGGAAAHEPVRRLLVQSLATDSPAGRATCSWGRLAAGDHLLRVDGVRVRTLTRLDCVRRLKEARVVVTLRVRRGARADPPQVIGLELKPPAAPIATAQAPPVPPRKLRAQPPLPAECYLDVVGLEERAHLAGSESDDTGSSLSTALERRSTANSSFSDALPPDPGRALERLEREIAASLDALLPPAEFKDTSPPDLPPRASPPPPRERFRSGKRRAPPPPPPALVEVDLRREADDDGVEVERVVTELVERFPSAVVPTASRRQSVPESRDEPSVSPTSKDEEASESEDEEPISLDYSVLEELAVPPPAGVAVDDASAWLEDAEFRVTAVTTPGDALFPSGWGAALPTILEEDAVVVAPRTETKPRLVVQPAEDVVVVEKVAGERVAVERVPVERVSVVARVSEDGGERLAKEATMEPPPPPFSRLPPDGHEFPARYEEDGFRFKPEPKPRRGQAEGTKTAPEVPARPSLDEPGTFRCKVEVELEMGAFRPVPCKAEEFKTVPSNGEVFRQSDEEHFRTLPSKADKLAPEPSKVGEFKPVPNEEEEFRSTKAEEFTQVSSTAKYSRTLSGKTGEFKSNKTESFVTLTSNVDEFRPSKTESFMLVTTKTAGFRPSKAEDFTILPSKAEDFTILSTKAEDFVILPSKAEDFVILTSKTGESRQPPAVCKPTPTSKRENFVVSTSKVEEFRPANTEIFRPLPSKTEVLKASITEDFRISPSKAQESRPALTEILSKKVNFRPRKADEPRPSNAKDARQLANMVEDVRASGKTEEWLPERGPTRMRPASWRSDERSDQSVRDKIAMFGRPTDAPESAAQPRRPPSQHFEPQETRSAGSSTLPRRPHGQHLDAQERAVGTSTLPRKPSTRHGFDDAAIARRNETDNPRLHTRSHSLLDLTHRPLDELRRTSLAALVEQRRRGMSKLRGLVIPERTEPAPPAPGALDLPEIHSREEAALEPWPRGRASSVTASSIPGYASLPGYAALPSLPLPKTSPPLPKTLPPTLTTQNSAPFLRSKDTFVLSLKQESAPAVSSLPPIAKSHESWMSTAKPNGPPLVFPKNGLPTVMPKLNGLPTAAAKPNATATLKSNGLAPTVTARPKGPSTVTLKSSGPSVTTKLTEALPPATYVSFLRPQTSFVSTLRPSEAVPRAASAVEGKTEMPPPLPPSLPPSLPPTRDDFDGLPRESGHASASRTSSVDSSGGRILAPRSLEAMNRKSVLCSARHSSGRDLKIGSPQIQRKFSDSEDSDEADDADEDGEDSDDDDDDFCEEGALECDDLVFFPGRAKAELPDHAKPEFLGRHKPAVEDLGQPPIRVAYVTHVTDPEMPYVTELEMPYVTLLTPEMVHVNDGGRRRLLVSGQPRAESKLVARARGPKASLNEALNELVAPREAASKIAKKRVSVDENQNDFAKESPKGVVVKATVERNCKEQALKASLEQISKEKALKESLEQISKEKVLKESLEQISKEKALKESLEQISKEKALKASLDQISKEKALKAFAEQTSKEQALKALLDKSTADQALKAAKIKPPKASTDQIPNGQAPSSPKEQTPRASKSRTSKDRAVPSAAAKPPREPPKEQAGATPRDRRCVSVSEIHTAFQKAERMTHARSVSLDADACAWSATNARMAELEVVLRRATPSAGLGLALAGGADLEAKRVTVHKVLQGGAAARDGRLRRGDHVVRINGNATRGLTHAQSVAALKEPRLEVTLTVLRSESETEPSGAEPIGVEADCVEGSQASAGEVTVTLVKEAAGLGFSLDGGRDSPLGDVPLTVKKLFLGGVAERSGFVREGDRVLRIGAWDVAQMSRLEAWAAMKRLPEGPVVLTFGPAQPGP